MIKKDIKRHRITNENCNSDYTTIVGGYINHVTGQYTFIGGGRNNIAVGNYSMTVGVNNGLNLNYTTITNGTNNVILNNVPNNWVVNLGGTDTPQLTMDSNGNMDITGEVRAIGNVRMNTVSNVLEFWNGATWNRVIT